MTTRLFAHAGAEVGRLDLPDTAPVVTGHIPAPPGAPTVLLYSHYDVVPAGDEAEWKSPPFEPTERDGALFGRGVADTKSNIVAHVGALRAWDGKPPVGIKLCIEGSEEIGSGALPSYPATDPDLFQADALVIADMGSIRPGVPTLTTALRGMGNVTLEVRTLESGKHSGQYGGAAPDALLAVLRAIASLHDEHGNVAVAGLRRNEWEGRAQPEEDFRGPRDCPRQHAANRHRRPRLACLVGSCDHGHRHRRAVGRRRRQRRLATRARGPQRPRASRAGRHPGTVGGPGAPAQREAVRHRDRRAAGPDGRWFRRRLQRSGLRRSARRLVGRLGSRRYARRERRFDSDRRARSREPCRMPRRCWSARRTATPTSTARTSACS